MRLSPVVETSRILLAGTGLIGHRHLRHIQEHGNLTLAGIVDPDPEGRAMADVPGFESLEDVDVPADAILLATPTHTHAPLTIAAAKRGWHVLVEKPMAGSVADADAMIAAAESNGVQVLVGHHRRHHPHVARLKELLASGAIGQPVTAALIWTMKKPECYFDVPWRAGIDGAPVKQNLIHDVDMLRWFFGEVTEVAGFGGNAIRGAARTEAGGALLRFDTGVIVTLAFADCTPTPWGFEAGTGESPSIAHTGQDYLRISGTEGALEFPSLRIWSGAKDWSEAPQPNLEEAPDGVPLIRQLTHFHEVIQGRAAPLVSGREGRETLAATLEIERATLPPGVSP